MHGPVNVKNVYISIYEMNVVTEPQCKYRYLLIISENTEKCNMDW